MDSNQVKTAKKELADLGYQAKSVSKNIDGVGHSANKTANALGFFNRSIFTMKNLVGTVMAVSILKSADNMAMLRARVEQATESNDEFIKSFAALKKMSGETGATLQSAVDVFQRLSFSRKEIKATVDDMLSFTKTVQSLAVVSGTSTQNLEAGLRQLGQSMSSGLVRAEEFNSLLENIPAVANMAAEGLGLTTGQLRQLVIEGKLTSKMMFDVIKGSEGVVKAMIDEYNSHNILQVSFNKLRQEIGNYIDDVNQTYGVTAFLSEILSYMATHLPEVASGFMAAASGLAAFMLVINIPKLTALVGLLSFNPWLLLAGAVAATTAALVHYEQKTGNVTTAVESLNSKLLEAAFNATKLTFALMGMDQNQVPSITKQNYSSINLGSPRMTPYEKASLGSSAIVKSGVENLSEINVFGKKPSEMGLTTVQQQMKLFKTAMEENQKEAKKLFDSLSNGNGKLSDEQKALNKLIDQTATAQEKYNATVKDLEKLRGFAKTKEEIRAIERALVDAKKELDEVTLKVELDSPLAQNFKRLFEEIDDGFKDAFKDAFAKTDGGFKKMIEGFKSTFKNLLADLAYQALVRPIIVSVLGAAGGSMGLSGQAMASITGTAGGGGIGGIGNIFSLARGGFSQLGSGIGNIGFGGTTINSIGGSLGFSPGMAPGMYGPAAPGTMFGGTTLGGALGAAGLGFAAGNFLGMIGGNRTGGSIGGGLGAGIGMAIGGPIGGLIGGALGGVGGGFFGGSGTPRQTLGANIGASGVTRASTKGGSIKDAKSFGEQIYAALGAITQKIGANIIGGFTAETNIGTEDPGTFFQSARQKQMKVSGSKGDVFSIVRAAIMGGNVGGGDPAVLDVLKKSLSISKDVQQVMSDVDFAMSILSDKKVNPLQDALKALDEQFKQMRDRAVQLGLPLEKVNAQLAEQKDALIKNFLSPLQEFLDSQALSQESSLSPVKRLSMARSMFDETLSAVNMGDFTDMNKLADQAKTLLDVGRDVFASSEAFAALESFVRQSISGVAGSLGAPGALNDEVSRDIVLSNAKQTSIMEQMALELRDLREENIQMRKAMERVGNALMAQ